MRITIAILIVGIHAVLAHPYGAPNDAYNSGGLAQGYIRYIDVNGAERLVGYSYPEPLYTVHRLSFDGQKSGSNPLLKTSVQPGYIEQEYIYKDGGDMGAIREQHFRGWNLQRYQALKCEVDKMYAQGQSPSADMLRRLKELEDMSANMRSGINETPEVQKAREEHLRLWNEARLRQLNAQGQTQAQIGSQSIGSDKQDVVIESAELQKARQEHFRLYNEQLLRIGQYADGTKPIFQQLPADSFDFQQTQTGSADQINGGIMDTPEVKQAKAEHFRLFNEAKKRAEESPESPQSFSTRFSDTQIPFKEYGNPIQSQNAAQTYNAFDAQKGTVKPATKFNSDNQQISDVQRATEEHLRLWNEAKERAESASKKTESSFSGTPASDASIKQFGANFQGQKYLAPDSSDFVAAREQHFRDWNAQRYQTLKSEIDILYAQGQTPSADMLRRLKEFETMSTITTSSAINESPETQKAREEHLRIWNEERLKLLNLQNEKAKQSFDINSRTDITDNAELQKAREEHLRLYNEQLLRIRNLESDAKKISSGQINNAFSFSAAQSNPAEQIMNTPEVQRAQAEHLRLWNEAKQRAEAASNFNQESQVKQLTSEIFQQPGQVQATQFIQTKDASTPFDFKAADAQNMQQMSELEREKFREMERIREETKMRELERLREAERRQQEEKALEAERARLRAEEEARLRIEGSKQQESSNNFAIKSAEAPAGVYILNKKYEHNPFLLRFGAAAVAAGTPAVNTKTGYYYSIPAGKTVFAFNSNTLPFQTTATNQQVAKIGDQQALAELEKATREHFQAHEQALRQLNLANKQTAKPDCN